MTTCKVDNQKVFEEEEFYTTKCEACGFFCKLSHYRACELRHEWNKENGVDVFASVRDIDRLAKAQLGEDGLPKAEPKKGKKKKTARHRGR